MHNDTIPEMKRAGMFTIRTEEITVAPRASCSTYLVYPIDDKPYSALLHRRTRPGLPSAAAAAAASCPS